MKKTSSGSRRTLRDLPPKASRAVTIKGGAKKKGFSRGGGGGGNNPGGGGGGPTPIPES